MSSVEWRPHYVALLKEGEAAGLKLWALGHYIASRMTPDELRAAFRDFHNHNTTTGGKL